MSENKITKTIQNRIAEKIESGAIAMKPKWHFILHAVVLAVAFAAVGVLSLFMARVLFFQLRVSEIAELTGFGPRGWTTFLEHFPWAFLVTDVALVVGIALGVRSFRSGARIPAANLLLALLFIAGILGFALDRAHFAPRFMTGRPPLPPGSGVCRCEVKEVDKDRIIGTDAHTGKNYMIIVPLDAPYASRTDLKPGDHIFVAGEMVGTDTIRAFGLHKRGLPHELFDDESREHSR